MARASGTDLRGIGRYEIVREIGRGGTATVYLARQIDLGRSVALKELAALSGSDPLVARRFVRESRLAGSLNHPNIVTVHDFFEDDATPYIAMEYLERGSLRPSVRDLTFAQIAGVLEGLLAGLAHAHELGIVHRDIKPENLLLTRDGRVKIGDFGIAKASDEAKTATMLTATGTTIGTPAYMAPEQALAQDVGPWTDLYATGVIAFEMLAGRPPFDTTVAPMAILLQHVNTPAPQLSAVLPSVDPRLSDWVDRLLAKEPGDRTQTARAAWLAFEEIVLDQLGSRWRRDALLLEMGAARATPATLALGDMPTARPQPTPSTRPTRRQVANGPGRRFPWRRVRTLVLATIAVAVALLAATSGGGSTPPPATPAAVPSVTSPPAPASPVPTPIRPAASGVGDSRSDDPSDDEPDGPDP